ncbi:acyl-CoA dehydrogenase family protein [Acidiferrimicrobium sp. IK]|uniref:acyl-CoA dehydrogenase family protein n=1 Tax=Acidiferrimicrobium sp. IK TaxID=2871700 RepID=UPI0021CB4A8E|nr:acyl-CoA dehydrogenase family protein [Acidiferrimicrobium sp. IK]MCU4182850.1 acyl-CoA dehydrogenase family protein [Acidiferrimicrobium sp. IK]
MDFDLAPPDDPRRLEVRAWLAAHPSPSARQLVAAGYVVPHWPAPWGLDADPVYQLIIDEELAGAGVRRPLNPIGIGWAAPTILLAGTDAQKQRYLAPALAGEEIWCQLFSEPDAGSDLASLATRAERDGDEWVVNGSKIWTSGAHHSRFGILIARTDPDVAKHRGISYFICPMDAPGISMTPIIDMTTAHSFNQVFFDDVRLPADAIVGQPGDGWRLAKATLANERVSLSSGGALWGMGPTAEDLLRLVRDAGGVGDPLQRQRLAALFAESEVLRLIRLRSLSARLAGKSPGPEVSVQKLLADEHGQHLMAVAKDLVGAAGMLAGSGPAGRLEGRAAEGPTSVNPRGRSEEISPIWHYGFLFSPALTIGGGTWAVQRNIIAERVLGLPGEPDPQRGAPWATTRA